jgi:hypothetical protein
MTDLVEFLRAALDEDERVARVATPGPWRLDAGLRLPEQIDVVSVDYFTVCEDLEDTDAAHIARHDPARVLAEVAAKRKLLDEYEAASRDPDTDPEVLGYAAGLDVAVQHVSQGFAGRPGWREEWRA